MPHFDSNDKVQHVTFHLADSLPADVLAGLAKELDLVDPQRREVERRKRIDALMDEGHGSCVLREPEVAAMTQESLLCFDGDRYRVFAWVVMPNHVHVLFQTMSGWRMGKVVASWKAYTGKRSADRLFWERQPPSWHESTRQDGVQRFQVWHREYWDRFIRDEKHFAAAAAYVHENPVKAGLVRAASDWLWSSARMSIDCARTEPGVPGEESAS